MPNNTPGPAPKLENTGTPIKPKRIYTITVSKPFFNPSRPAAAHTAKVWSVMGTASGIWIHEQTAITAAKMPIYTTSVVLNLFLFSLLEFIVWNLFCKSIDVAAPSFYFMDYTAKEHNCQPNLRI